MKPTDIRTTLVSAGAHLPEGTALAIVALGPTATAPLLDVFLDEDLRNGTKAPFAPAHAAELLGALTPDEALQPLIDAYARGHHDTPVGEATARAIPNYGAHALQPLLHAYDDAGTAPTDRSFLCLLLSELGVHDDRIYDRLVQSFPHDMDMGASSFSVYGDPRALPLLQQALDAWAPDTAGMPDHPFELGHAIRDLGGELTPQQQAKLEAAAQRNALEVRGTLLPEEREAALRDALAKATARPFWNIRGFLAALASGPSFVPPHQWVGVLLPDGDGDAPSAIRLVEQLIPLYNETLEAMDDGASTLLCPAPDDAEACADFCEGYMDAARRDPEWLPAHRARPETAPLLLLTAASNTSDMSDADRAVASAHVRLHLHTYLDDIHDTLARARAMLDAQRRQPVTAEPKVGRNDPCPCNSGKKYKRCCGKPGQAPAAAAPTAPSPQATHADEPEILYSPLCRRTTVDGRDFRILIYRAEDERGWLLEVEDDRGGSTVWDDRFERELHALEEAVRAFEEEGPDALTAG